MSTMSQDTYQLSTQALQSFIKTCVGRLDDYAVQQADGSYRRQFQPLSYEVLYQHLRGDITIGSYLINADNLCSHAVYDSDTPDGLYDLAWIRYYLAGLGVPSYLERSRRGGHLHVFADRSVSPFDLRAWLRPSCPAGVEFYPKQDTATWEHPGSLMRLPLGVHRLTGERYPFVDLINEQFQPVACSLMASLFWLETVQRVTLPAVSLVTGTQHLSYSTQQEIAFSHPSTTRPPAPQTSIWQWCKQQSAVGVISRYVSLDCNGMGCCPFGWHHAGGQDRHPSFHAYTPADGDICCWYCHTWQQGGSLFDFLRYWYNLDAKTLWRRLLQGEQF